MQIVQNALFEKRYQIFPIGIQIYRDQVCFDVDKVGVILFQVIQLQYT